MFRQLIPLLLLYSLFWIGCKKLDVPKGTPGCIKKEIREISRNKGGCDQPLAIYKYEFKGETVYFINYGKACGGDMSDIVWDEKCNLICSPAGGITGGGDQKCPDFFQESTNAQLIWIDERY